MSSIELPKISLVTTCLNQLPQLKECTDSVLDQQYSQLEYIIVDRGSSDGSPEFLQRLSASTITVLEEPELDQAEAINKGLAIASGSIMGLLNPEDKFFHLGLFRVALLFLNDWKVNWVAGKQVRWLPGGDYEDNDFHAWNIRNLITAYQGEYRAFPQSATFWRRPLYDLAGAKFGPGECDAAVLDLWLRFYEHVDLHSADALICGYGTSADLTSTAQENNLAVIRRSQGAIDKANRRSTSPGSLRCVINTGHFLRLLREARAGYEEVNGVSVYRGRAAGRDAPPLLICYGMPKSASSFTWKIACSIAGGDNLQNVLSQQLPEEISNRFLQPLDERCLAILELLPPGVTYVPKTHGLLSTTIQTLVTMGLAKAVVSVRNPYDMVASLVDVGVSERKRPPEKQRKAFTSIYSFEDALNYTLRFIDSCREWLNYAVEHDFPVIHFEQVKNSPESIATQIGDLLGVAVDPAAIVDPLLENKSEKIPEFNVGISGRGQELFKNYNNPAVTRYLDGFNNLIDKYR